MNNEEMHVITEVGVFGDLDMEDPTIKKVKKKDKTMEEIIAEGIKANRENL